MNIVYKKNCVSFRFFIYYFGIFINFDFFRIEIQKIEFRIIKKSLYQN